MRDYMGNTPKKIKVRGEYMSLKLFKSSVPVPNVLRIPGTAGRW